MTHILLLGLLDNEYLVYRHLNEGDIDLDWLFLIMNDSLMYGSLIRFIKYL